MIDPVGDQDHSLTLFGGDKTPWRAEDWTASDDRVRGGKSKSYLECSDDTARFHGDLDNKTLGGAGFASQHTTGDDRKWDLSKYAGIQLNVNKGDKKRYTFILKDELLPPNKDNNRERASISYECDFDLPPQAEPGNTVAKSIFIPWSALNPTYRGRIVKDARPLKKDGIKRFSIMNRSFFGTQEGPFSLTLKSVVALQTVPTNTLVVSSTTDAWEVESGQPRQNVTTLVGFKIDTRYLQLEVRVHRALVLAMLAALTCTSLYGALHTHA